MDEGLLERFCTPPVSPQGESEIRLLASANAWETEFEGMTLYGYSWGEGPDVLLLHGWGSRSGHLALMAKQLSLGGYRVSVFDAPAHGRTEKPGGVCTSSFFEYCRAMYLVSDRFKRLHALIGHSMGAAAAALGVAGYGFFDTRRIAADHLVLISSPSGIGRMLEAFCRGSGVLEHCEELKTKLEAEFGFSIKDYDIYRASAAIKCKSLIIHDSNDKDVPVDDAYELAGSIPGARIHVTSGLGHQRLLVSRDVLKEIKSFIGEKT